MYPKLVIKSTATTPGQAMECDDWTHLRASRDEIVASRLDRGQTLIAEDEDEHGLRLTFA